MHFSNATQKIMIVRCQPFSALHHRFEIEGWARNGLAITEGNWTLVGGPSEIELVIKFVSALGRKKRKFFVRCAS